MPGRARLGLGMAEVLSGPVPFKLHGRVAATRSREPLPDRGRSEGQQDHRAAARLVESRRARPRDVSFTAIDKPQLMRFDDIVIEGPGTLVKGMIELDSNGEIVLASFPSFALSDGDKATLRADRAPDGTLKVTMRGELFDGRGFIKSATSSQPADKGKPQSRDFDLDVKLGDRHRLQCRGAARRRTAHVAAQRPRAPVRHDRQARQQRRADPATCAPIRAGGG